MRAVLIYFLKEVVEIAETSRVVKIIASIGPEYTGINSGNADRFVTRKVDGMKKSVVISCVIGTVTGSIDF